MHGIRKEERKGGRRVTEMCFEKGFHEEGAHFAGTLPFMFQISALLLWITQSASHRILAIYDLKNV